MQVQLACSDPGHSLTEAISHSDDDDTHSPGGGELDSAPGLIGNEPGVMPEPAAEPRDSLPANLAQFQQPACHLNLDGQASICNDCREPAEEVCKGGLCALCCMSSRGPGPFACYRGAHSSMSDHGSDSAREPGTDEEGLQMDVYRHHLPGDSDVRFFNYSQLPAHL